MRLDFPSTPFWCIDVAYRFLLHCKPADFMAI